MEVEKALKSLHAFRLFSDTSLTPGESHYQKERKQGDSPHLKHCSKVLILIWEDSEKESRNEQVEIRK